MSDREASGGQPLVIGMIGLDTTRCPVYARLCNDPQHSRHVPGGVIRYGCRGGDPELAISRCRITAVTERLTGEWGMELLATYEELAERSDAVMITSVSGRKHLEEFKAVAPFRKPVFIDKPLALTVRDAEEIGRLAERYGTPVMSASSLRFSPPLLEAARQLKTEGICGADAYGPMELEDSQPGLFWYGIHAAEMLYAALGTGCTEVQAFTSPEHEFVTGSWSGGRFGTIRGSRTGNPGFGAALHGRQRTLTLSDGPDPQDKYAGTLRALLRFFRSGIPEVSLSATLEIIRFLEAANESRATGRRVRL
ncbi:Gfo/Idh/MocA family oxidoreductase [Paenibacillus sp. FSL K6-1096]|uniref:Gfo/Idh/MocA family protein n=1 Tax=Paenibacillus sp. FSL K6-1096 TaxID=2921460 RepID=UPI0030ED6ECE